MRLDRDERLPLTRPILRELTHGVQQGLHHVHDVLFASFVVQREPQLVQAVLAGQPVLQALADDADRPPGERDGAQGSADREDQQDVAERQPAVMAGVSGGRSRRSPPCLSPGPVVYGGGCQVRELRHGDREDRDAHEEADDQQDEVTGAWSDHGHTTNAFEDRGERQQRLDRHQSQSVWRHPPWPRRALT